MSMAMFKMLEKTAMNILYIRHINRCNVRCFEYTQPRITRADARRTRKVCDMSAGAKSFIKRICGQFNIEYLKKKIHFLENRLTFGPFLNIGADMALHG